MKRSLFSGILILSRTPIFRRLGAALAVAALSLTLSSSVRAATKEKVIYSFTGGNDGGNAWAALIFDSAGNLYGTVQLGGPNGRGAVFMLSPGSNGIWAENVIDSFGLGVDGANPLANLIFDANGNLYSTGNTGGFPGPGTVFELSPGTGGTWTETNLYSFGNSHDGADPFSGVILDSAGNLYGTTTLGGRSGVCANGCGTVFELTAPNWNERLLHTFSGGIDGAQPYSGLVTDPSGSLYGTASLGGNVSKICVSNGSPGCGVVFKLTLGSSGKWTETVLHTFTGGNDGGVPFAGLIFDAAGNLYGTASQGGAGSGGVVFKLTPGSNGRWTETVLHAFTPSKITGIYTGGNLPWAGLIFDAAGNLYGTTLQGGANGSGAVFKLTPGSTGKWTETVLHSFGKSSLDGDAPYGGVIFDSVGNLYGTTYVGGSYGQGAVYEITP